MPQMHLFRDAKHRGKPEPQMHLCVFAMHVNDEPVPQKQRWRFE